MENAFEKYCHKVYKVLLPTGSEEREVLEVGSIPVEYFPHVKTGRILHYNCINMNIVG